MALNATSPPATANQVSEFENLSDSEIQNMNFDREKERGFQPQASLLKAMMVQCLLEFFLLFLSPPFVSSVWAWKFHNTPTCSITSSLILTFVRWLALSPCQELSFKGKKWGKPPSKMWNIRSFFSPKSASICNFALTLCCITTTNVTTITIYYQLLLNKHLQLPPTIAPAHVFPSQCHPLFSR